MAKQTTIVVIGSLRVKEFELITTVCSCMTVQVFRINTEVRTFLLHKYNVVGTH